ncbi:hypothetical protein HOY82DRAFT_477742 [Tuber indicum]|nr:hypothetical protein HOY82DRAFT_477742 [Tuber indicum]
MYYKVSFYPSQHSFVMVLLAIGVSPYSSSFFSFSFCGFPCIFFLVSFSILLKRYTDCFFLQRVLLLLYRQLGFSSILSICLSFLSWFIFFHSSHLFLGR